MRSSSVTPAITRGADKPFLERVPGCMGQPHTVIEGAGHFLQEDRGAELGKVIADWVSSQLQHA